MASQDAIDQNDKNPIDWQHLGRKATPYLFLLPAMIVLSLAVFWPAVQAFFLSFSEFGDDIVSPPSWVGLKNFYRLWRDQVFWQALINTLLYIIFAVPILVFAPLGLAILVNQRLRGIQWFRAAYYTPVVISMVVAGIAWGWLFDQRGLLNTMGRWLVDSNPWVQEGWRWLSQNIPPIQSLNDWLLLSERGIPWLTNPNIVLFCVMVVTIWKGLGYYMVIYLAGLQAIPADLYEAASIDGSDGIRRHLDITLPLMKPYLMLVGVLSAISATKVFEEIFIMTKGGPLFSSTTVVYHMYEQAFGPNLDINYACAMGLVLYLIIFTLSLLNLWLRRGKFSSL